MLWWHNKSILHNKSISKRLLRKWDDGAQGEMSDNRTDNLSGHDSDYRGIRGSHHRQRYENHFKFLGSSIRIRSKAWRTVAGRDALMRTVRGGHRNIFVMFKKVTTMMTTTSTMGTTSSGFGSTTSQSDKYYHHGNYAKFDWALNFQGPYLRYLQYWRYHCFIALVYVKLSNMGKYKWNQEAKV